MLVSEIYERDLFSATFYNTRTQQHFPATYSMLFQYVLGKHLGLFIIWLFCLIMDIAIFAFLSYHLLLIARGQTTNETYKWAAVKRIHKKMVTAYKDYSEKKEVTGVSSPVIPVQNQLKEFKSPLSGVVSQGETNVGCIPPLSTHDSTESNNTLRDGLTPPEERSRDQQTISDDDVPIDPGPFPTNIYNKGFFTNLREIIFSHRKGDLENSTDMKKKRVKKNQ
jgi:hypothetical protein